MIKKIFGTKESIREQIDFINSLPMTKKIKDENINGVFKQYTPFKLLQRTMAIIFSLLYILAMVIALAAHYNGVDYKEIVAIITAFNVGMVMLAIVGFYFGGGALDSLKKK